MTEIVFLVESVDRYGRPYTLGDKLKTLSPEWHEHYHSEIMTTYISCVGKKITFQPYSATQNYDPNKKYYYFIVVDHFNFDFPVYFQMLGKTKLNDLHRNNIPLLFAHDLETIPHLDYTFFVKQLEWLFLMRGVYSDVQNKIIMLNASSLVPRQAEFIKNYFYNGFHIVQSPLLLKYSADELLQIYPTEQELVSLHDTPKIRQFTNLNRTPRYHRSTLIHGFRSQGIVDQGYVSNGHSVHYSNDVIPTHSEYSNAVRNDMAQCGPIPVMVLDEYIFTDNRPRSLPPFPSQLWNTYYDIVSETASLYYMTDPMDLTIVTEKTVKSLLMMRPFMINGGPYILKYLKKLGFKTYDFMFDESYDEVESLIDRQEIIVNNVQRYRYKYDTLQKLIPAIRTTAEFNRRRLLSADYEQLLINELVAI